MESEHNFCIQRASSNKKNEYPFLQQHREAIKDAVLNWLAGSKRYGQIGYPWGREQKQGFKIACESLLFFILFFVCILDSLVHMALIVLILVWPNSKF
jgi:hypothetical protein